MQLTITELTSGLAFPEGPIALRDGSVLVSDDGGKVIWRVSYKKG